MPKSRRRRRAVAPGRLPSAPPESYEFWRSKGLTSAQAAGLVGMEQGESNFDPNSRGDWTGGRPGVGRATAGGSFQWHQDRRNKILAATGIDVYNSTHAQQLEAAHWEMTKGQESKFWPQIKAAGSAGEAAAIGVYKFERPEDKKGASLRRGIFANDWQRRAEREGWAGPSAPAAPNASGDADFFPNGAPRVLKPNSMKDAPGLTMEDANRRRAAERKPITMKDILPRGMEGVFNGGLPNFAVPQTPPPSVDHSRVVNVTNNITQGDTNVHGVSEPKRAAEHVGAIMGYRNSDLIRNIRPSLA